MDGNGRVARVMMNAELAAAQQVRVLIPIVYRSNYISALRALSRNAWPEPIIKDACFRAALCRRRSLGQYRTGPRRADANECLRAAGGRRPGKGIRLRIPTLPILRTLRPRVVEDDAGYARGFCRSRYLASIWFGTLGRARLSSQESLTVS